MPSAAVILHVSANFDWPQGKSWIFRKPPEEVFIKTIDLICGAANQPLDGVASFLSHSVFSVKTVPRRIDNPVREYVRRLI